MSERPFARLFQMAFENGAHESCVAVGPEECCSSCRTIVLEAFNVVFVGVDPEDVLDMVSGALPSEG